MSEDTRCMLLQQLVYFDFDSNCDFKRGQTLGEWISDFKKNKYYNSQDEKVFSTFYKKVIDNVAKDPILCGMKISDVNKPRSDDSGLIVAFVDERKNSAIVTFKGTEREVEWADNARFLKYNADGNDGVSTRFQEESLKFYRKWHENNKNIKDIVVSGHSKGGNNATYVTVMDDTNSIRKAVTVNPVGFTKEFYNKYGDRIKAKRDIIYNNINEHDAIPVLLNLDGHNTYYKDKYDNYKTAHFLSSLFDFDNPAPGEPFGMEQTVQSEDMKKLGKFIRSWISDMSLKDRNENVEILCKYIEKSGNHKSKAKAVSDILETKEFAVKNVDYIRDYMFLHPDFIPVLSRYIDDITGDNKKLRLRIWSVILFWEEIKNLDPFYREMCEALSFFTSEDKQNWIKYRIDELSHMFKIPKILFPDEKGVSTGEELKSSPVATSTSQINNTSLFIQSDNLNQDISSLTQLKKNIEKTSGMIEFRAFAADSRFSRKYSGRIANIKGNISGLSGALNNINEELNSINSTYKNCETDILNYLNSSFKA